MVASASSKIHENQLPSIDSPDCSENPGVPELRHEELQRKAGRVLEKK